MLVCLSAHQRTTPFTSLERLSAIGDDAGARVASAHGDIRGAVVVSTCNRFEAYVELADGTGSPVPAMDAAIEAIADLAELPFRDVRTAVEVTAGNRVAQHLFSVASGLESVAVGETEIAGQVRRSLESAREQGLTSPGLETLFQKASETSRTVKNTTNLGESGRSLVRLAVDLAGSRIGAWADARVLLVGTGRYAAASLAALRAVGAGDIRVHSRSGRRSFADREGLTAVSIEGFDAEAAAADVIVTCTSTADEFALTGPEHALARASVTTGQVVIDLGMPRNVDPRVADIDGVELLDLETVRIHAPVDEFALIDQANELIEEAVHRHAVARRVDAVAPAVVTMREHIHARMEAEITRLQARGGDAGAEAALRHFAGVLLHDFIGTGHQAAAAGDGATWSQAVTRVFAPGDRA